MANNGTATRWMVIGLEGKGDQQIGTVLVYDVSWRVATNYAKGFNLADGADKANSCKAIVCECPPGGGCLSPGGYSV